MLPACTVSPCTVLVLHVFLLASNNELDRLDNLPELLTSGYAPVVKLRNPVGLAAGLILLAVAVITLSVLAVVIETRRCLRRAREEYQLCALLLS